MRHSPLFYLIRALAGAALLASAAQAAELGDIAVRSFIGQPLAADIELVSLAPDEVNALQVRLAQADVFRGANITMNPALASVRMSVVRRDQKQFLHVTTTRAIEADYVHLYVELSAAGRQDVRLATVWLQADPNPAPPAPVSTPVPLAAAMTPAEAGQIAAQAKTERAAKAAGASSVAGSAESAAAAPAALVRDRLRPAPMPSAHESEVGAPGALRAAAIAPAVPVRRVPASAAVRDLPERIAGVLETPRAAVKKPSASKEGATGDGAAVPLNVAQALLPLPPLPLPKGIKRQEAPAACTPSDVGAKECLALDNHNAALSSKLVELEGKVKLLQGALSGSAAASTVAPARAGKLATTTTPSASAAAAASHPASASASAGASSHAVAAPASTAASAPVAPAKASAAVATHAAPALAATAAASHPASAPASSTASSHAPAASAAASASAPAPRAVQASASASGTAPASALAAQVETPAASASAGSGSAAASAAAAASAPVKLVRVLPKLKYKKEKPVESPTNYPALIAGGVGVLLLGAAGFVYLRKRKAGGGGPLKIWQGFRRKTPADPVAAASPPAPAAREAAPESVAS